MVPTFPLNLFTFPNSPRQSPQSTERARLESPNIPLNQPKRVSASREWRAVESYVLCIAGAPKE